MSTPILKTLKAKKKPNRNWKIYIGIYQIKLLAKND